MPLSEFCFTASGNKPLEQQEYLLPTIIWSMLTALGLSLLVFAVTALMR